MQPTSIKTVRNDMHSLVRDAKELFREATSATGDRADELIAKGLTMLDTAVAKAQDVQVAAVETGKEVVKTTDEYVRENPWKAVAVSAGVGLLVGMLIARK
ncbi:MAG: hypothetical protein K0S28_973 [Paucimonas sp.]|jgi:ElaB/YqjD/DUF883 family membrane-anchored ribosome-binding protein|nr:hypothetical protein [Paucimonas sp.]